MITVIIDQRITLCPSVQKKQMWITGLVRTEDRGWKIYWRKIGPWTKSREYRSPSSSQRRGQNKWWLGSFPGDTKKETGKVATKLTTQDEVRCISLDVKCGRALKALGPKGYQKSSLCQLDFYYIFQVLSLYFLCFNICNCEWIKRP